MRATQRASVGLAPEIEVGDGGGVLVGVLGAATGVVVNVAIEVVEIGNGTVYAQ